MFLFQTVVLATWAVVTLIGANGSETEKTTTKLEKRSVGSFGFALLAELLSRHFGLDSKPRSRNNSSLEQGSANSRPKSGQEIRLDRGQNSGSELLSGSGYYFGVDQAPVLAPSAGPIVPVSRDVHITNHHVQQVSVPYPVPVHHDVAVPVVHPVPYAVDSPYPVHVPAPYPVPVERPVPYAVDRPVLHAQPAPYPVPVVHDVPVPVSKPYPFKVVRRVPVPVTDPHVVSGPQVEVAPLHVAKDYGYGLQTPITGYSSSGNGKSTINTENHSSESLAYGYGNSYRYKK